MKKCSACKSTKELSEFNKCKTYADGFSTICRTCARARVNLSRKRMREQGTTPAPKDLKELFFYHTVIDEKELDKTSHLTYGEILEIFENILNDKAA